MPDSRWTVVPIDHAARPGRIQGSKGVKGPNPTCQTVSHVGSTGQTICKTADVPKPVEPKLDRALGPVRMFGTRLYFTAALLRWGRPRLGFTRPDSAMFQAYAVFYVTFHRPLQLPGC
ncbi:DNA repair protein XRCC1 [Anopheles sinensis]|uniref:DNA repair protein XRCC1 n=1 Tax=Anopheles sinensis TaxID=74873 RepID=A0A084W743_ANOSI|nr:DNA repair protein XRCC1 [Anopheles sinensis]